MVRLGIEKLIATPPAWLAGQRLGLVCNQASCVGFDHDRDLLARAFPGQLSCLFSPQHGFFSEKQDNMIESDHARDPVSGVPVFSLYGRERRPTAEMLDHVDLLLIDLVDVGTRVYTYMSTMAYCLEEAAARNIKVVVLDRPNPVGGVAVEGNILEEECRSFVGLYPIPMRHGMTMGELALYFNARLTRPADLEVMAMEGWSRSMLFPQTGLNWVFPSPNMPHFSTALVYPGQVIWEGTNISEGRGTSLPFELVGAPFMDCAGLLAYLESIPLPGCTFRPLFFEPTANKWNGDFCAGFQLHVTRAEEFLPYRTSLALLQALAVLHGDQLQMKEPPYEYEYERLPLDLILGSTKVRQDVLAGRDLLTVEQEWQEGLGIFLDERREFLLYS